MVLTRNFKNKSFLLVLVWYLLLQVLQPAYSIKENENAKERKSSENEDCDCMSSDFPWPLLLLSSGYNKEQVPRTLSITDTGVPEPLQISVSGVVQTIAPIVASETEFRVNMRFILEWEDRRLRKQDSCNISNSDVVILSDEVTKLMWLPTPYIINSKYEEIKRLNRKLVTLELSTSGRVKLTMIVNATVDCAMNFQWYPMDSQVCPMNIESFLYDDAYVNYNWNEDKPFQVIPRRLLQYDVDNLLQYTKSFSYRKQLERNFTRLTANFRFTRIWSNHFIQTFIPCTLIVSVSWFSFWLELDVTSARGNLLATSMLTLVTQFLSLRAVLPPAAYIKAVDVWMLVCMGTIFAAVMEFTLVKVLYSITEEIRQQNSVQSLSAMSVNSEGRWNWRADSNYYYDKDLYDHLHKVLYPCYRKNRLGSVVLSGRSTATTHLPSRLEWSIFFGKITIPLIWTTTATTVRNKNRHVVNEQSECRKMLLWRQVDVVSKCLFPTLFLLFSSAYWIVLVVNSSNSTHEDETNMSYKKDANKSL